MAGRPRAEANKNRQGCVYFRRGVTRLALRVSDRTLCGAAGAVDATQLDGSVIRQAIVRLVSCGDGGPPRGHLTTPRWNRMPMTFAASRGRLVAKLPAHVMANQKVARYRNNLKQIETPASSAGAAGGSEECQAGWRDTSEHAPLSASSQAASVAPGCIVAELTGSDTCTAAGITVTAYAPVLTLCRSLIAAGMSPDQAMECWRDLHFASASARLGRPPSSRSKTTGTGRRSTVASRTGGKV